jgi:hypothetical protein
LTATHPSFAGCCSLCRGKDFADARRPVRAGRSEGFGWSPPIIGEKHWSAVVTYREGRIHLISVRRSRKDDLNLSSARRANQEQKRISVDFPAWVVESLDREAARIGVTRQSIIQVWLVERLQVEAAKKPLNGDASGDAH